VPGFVAGSEGCVTCRECIDTVDDYLDAELDAAAQRRFDSHLESCNDCAAYVASYRAVIGLERVAARLDDPSSTSSLPDDVAEMILAAVKRQRS
jgi:anti-sigma factor RsiW